MFAETRRQIVVPVRNLEDVPIRWVELARCFIWYPKCLLIISSAKRPFRLQLVHDKFYRAILHHESFQERSLV